MMKMKKACEATFLTERAIRLYISKGLITPRQRDGLIDFSTEDIQLLRDIALLRQMDFSMEQIAGMLGREGGIPLVLAARRDAALSCAEQESQVASALAGLEDAEMADIHTLADALRARSVSPVVDFARFDEMDDETRQQESAAAMKAVKRQQGRKALLHRLGWAALLMVALAAAVAVFLGQTRIEGYLRLSPVTVIAVQGEYATFRIGNEEAIAVLGRDELTAPYQVDGFNTETRDLLGRPAVAAGETIDHACLLKIRLTCGDLLRLGVNPLQDFDPPSVRRHNEWMTLILRAVLEDGEKDDCLIMLRDYPATAPLLWTEE